MARIQAAVKKAQASCAARGETLTPLRRRVLEIVLARRGPAKAYDVLHDLQQERERAAPPTVYRALDFLVEMGILHRLDSLAAYVPCTHEDLGKGGLFFVCDKCRAVIEEHDARIDGILARKGKAAGFTVSSHEIEIRGLCSACR
jgi:Fur family transcriptional regulator, zinc uptake regulator